VAPIANNASHNIPLNFSHSGFCKNSTRRGYAGNEKARRSERRWIERANRRREMVVNLEERKEMMVETRKDDEFSS
jgi:hypothetical protein